MAKQRAYKLTGQDKDIYLYVIVVQSYKEIANSKIGKAEKVILS